MRFLQIFWRIWLVQHIFWCQFLGLQNFEYIFFRFWNTGQHKSNFEKISYLSTLNLSKFDELGHSSNFDKWPPNLIESDPRPLERIIMHFLPKLATQEAPKHPTKDPLPNQKNGQKNFFGPEMVKFGLVEISAPPKSTFLGWGGRIFFGPHQRGSKALVKSFWCRPNHFGALEDSQNRKLLKLGPKMRFCRNFCTPKIDLFGAGWSKFFRPAPKGS